MTSSAKASLIVRSVGRPELAEALASAGAQVHPHLEVIVVDATGGRHPPVPYQTGPHPIVFIPGVAPLRRPAAANAGLDAARGDYIGFLDDDDTLLPGHVAGLADLLDAAPEVGLAFSLAREIRPDGRVLLVGDARISRLTLLESCHFPPCAALFRRTIATRCRFDESLDSAEDWDFWIQASRVARFRLVRQETAIYRADLGRSAMTAGEPVAAQLWRDRVYGKWAKERDTLRQDVERMFEQALRAFESGDRTATATLTDAVLDGYPFHVGALNLRGSLRAMAGDFEAARSDFALASEVAPDDPASTFNHAQALEQLGRVAEAAMLYRRVLVTDAGHAQARTRLEALSG